LLASSNTTKLLFVHHYGQDRNYLLKNLEEEDITLPDDVSFTDLRDVCPKIKEDISGWPKSNRLTTLHNHLSNEQSIFKFFEVFYAMICEYKSCKYLGEGDIIGIIDLTLSHLRNSPPKKQASDADLDLIEKKIKVFIDVDLNQKLTLPILQNWIDENPELNLQLKGKLKLNKLINFYDTVSLKELIESK